MGGGRTQTPGSLLIQNGKFEIITLKSFDLIFRRSVRFEILCSVAFTVSEISS